MKLVIFADYGLDDACATVNVLMNRKAYDRVDIVPVGGNVQAETALANARKLLRAAQADGIELRGVRIVDTSAVPQPFTRLPSVHGEDGMGDLFENCASPMDEVAYGEFEREDHGEYGVLSLGPATVPARFLKNAKCLPAQKTVVMGGCVAEEPNFEGYEFNDALDLAAFSELLTYPHACATLDTCRNPRFNYIGKKFAEDTLLARLMTRSVSLASARHGDRCYIYDYIASLALLSPEDFSVTVMPYREGKISELKSKRNA